MCSLNVQTLGIWEDSMRKEFTSDLSTILGKGEEHLESFRDGDAQYENLCVLLSQAAESLKCSRL